MNQVEQRLGIHRTASVTMKRVLSNICDLAQSDAPVMILGETGTGKGALAETLHGLSPRRSRALVAVCCTGLKAEQLALELHGATEPRAATRDGRTSGGALSRARGGSLLLDDILALDRCGQAELLRTLNSMPSLVPGPQRANYRVPPRLICTSTADPECMVRAGSFRADLYHRLAAARVAVPPLRRRHGDVAILAAEFLGESALRRSRQPPSIAAEAIQLLEDHRMPGNLRELQQLMEVALSHCKGETLHRGDLQLLLERGAAQGLVELAIGSPLAVAERQFILQTLSAHNGNRQRAADALGIARRTLYEKLQRYADVPVGVISTDEAPTDAA